MLESFFVLDYKKQTNKQLNTVKGLNPGVTVDRVV